jgi:predicted ATPase
VIRNWSVNNFKSVSDATLPLAPLTLFAGANSSGKSTLLQSILLIAQTLSARASTQTVILNGHLIKLGQFDDLSNAVTAGDRIKICWTITTDTVEDWPVMRFRRLQSMIETASCDIVFGLSDSALRSEQLNPTLFESDLSATFRDTQEQGTRGSHIHLARKRFTQPSDQERTPVRGRNAYTSDFQITLDHESAEDLRDDYADAKPIACALQTFLPSSLVVDFDERIEIVRTIVAALTGTPRQLYARGVANTATKLPEQLIFELGEKLPELRETPAARQGFLEEANRTLQDLVDDLRRIRLRTVITPEIVLGVESAALATIPEKRDLTVSNLPGRSLGDAVEYTRDFFARQVKYLGPLREEPKARYPLQNTADPQDVGLHGEHTAAVLHRYRYTEVQYLPSANFSAHSTDTETKRTYLQDAVFDWLAYLDVAKKVDTSDEGKFGFGLRVTMEGSTVPHDLTHVGVGVSQVLPIVVMCLLAGGNTTVILEQPELHLNPKVQTRLADFFLSMAMLRKQCLIETHSEYLINRLRLRAVLATGSSVSDLLKLYFVEKAGGLTTYRDVRINEFGTILNWPKGFFDQSQREVEEILLAASRKNP